MKRLSGILWGIVLIAVGAVFALNALEITNIRIYFDGWWTLFIIVPCAIGLFSEREKTWNIIGILIGVLLLLACQNVLDFSILWKLLVPAIIIVVGLKLIFGNVFGQKRAEIIKALEADGSQLARGTAIFSGQNMNFDGEVFEGAELNAIFGGVKCDLTRAVIQKDCLIKATAIFGGVTILLPEHVNVKIKSNSLFGGVSDKSHRRAKENTFTVYINGTCMFGGVDIK